MRAGIAGGCRESWRVAHLGVIVKVTDYKQGARFIHQSGIVLRALGEPYDQIITQAASKMTRREWTERGPQVSAYTNHAVH